MWNCEECSEAIEDNFAACWNCGTARDGTPDPDFQRESGSDIQDDTADEDFVTKISDRFKCSKCECTDAKVRRITNISNEVGLFSGPGFDRFVAISCTHCGFTEFYDAKITGTNSFWDKLFPWVPVVACMMLA